MPSQKVLIVARTRMNGGRVCIGALSDQGEHLRLLNGNYANDLADQAPYRVGEWWKITFSRRDATNPPHVEDVGVSSSAKIGNQKNLADYLLGATTPWAGSLDALFEGKLRFTGSGSGYISPEDIPGSSTGFWLPNSILWARTDDRGKTSYQPVGDIRHVSYVGVEDAVGSIARDRLVRVSLARWWKPPDAAPDFELRCYAQISGWY